mmetsp:Transcript_11789/g.21387  ORF Transcript_11789/g.21387 Transcript_11789/m.21387 type:complete len:266 (+) Transcript_11789:965-1762(+)
MPLQGLPSQQTVLLRPGGQAMPAWPLACSLPGPAGPALASPMALILVAPHDHMGTALQLRQLPLPGCALWDGRKPAGLDEVAKVMADHVGDGCTADLSSLDGRQCVCGIQGWALGAPRQVLEDDVQDSEQSALIGFILGKLEKAGLPVVVLHQLDAVPVGCGLSKVVFVVERGRVVHVVALPQTGGPRGNGHGGPSHVVHWAHVDPVAELGGRPELNAALHEAPEEVVGVGDSRGGVSHDVPRPDDGGRQAGLLGLHDQPLRHPL